MIDGGALLKAKRYGGSHVKARPFESSTFGRGEGSKLTWLGHLARALGSGTWLGHLARVLGSGTWLGYLARVHGSGTWLWGC
jgi:hypothetical protein